MSLGARNAELLVLEDEIRALPIKELVVMTDDGLAAENDAGLGRVVARGHVSEDGKTVRTDPGQGIDRLTWLAVVPTK